MKASARKVGRVLEDYPDLSLSTYQRSVVWKPGQKAEFVRSVLKGYPTGLIILNDTRRPPIGPLPIPIPNFPDQAVHDVIDGQQRLTTIKEFLANPLIYFLEWQKHTPPVRAVPESEELATARVEIASLAKALGRRKEGFVTQGMTRADLREKLKTRALEFLAEKRTTRTVPDERFRRIVDALDSLVRAFSREQVFVAELDDFDHEEAETIYRVINTTGTPLMWWELLSVDHAFSKIGYPAESPYTTCHDDDIREIAGRYRPPRKLRTQLSTNDSFWSAFLALGERFQLALRPGGGIGLQTLLPDSERRLKVDGLGFRLVSGFLSHNISTVAVRSLFEDYSPDQIRQTTDLLFDTVTVLASPGGAPSTGFALFQKYARFDWAAIPAAPFLGIIIGAAKLLGLNAAQTGSRSLNPKDALKLRCMTEEIFRESLCTPKWAGSGDSKLRTWLDSHFEAVRKKEKPERGAAFPGRLITAASTYDDSAWVDMVRDLKATDRPTIDRRSAFLHFWTQYLYDSRIPGCLPRGSVEFDHIVAYQDGGSTNTSHPLNLAAIDRELNNAKRGHSFDTWNPTGGTRAAYALEALDSLSVQVGRTSGPGTSFLEYASHATISDMISTRRKIFDFAFTKILPNWIDDGDANQS